MTTPYQPYAPAPYLPRPLLPAGTNPDAEVKLYATNAQRELYESLAELHAIIVTLEFVEKAFVKDSIPPAAYTPTCLRLLGQYKTLLGGNDSVRAAFGDLDSFKARFGIDCPAATRRLLTGLPATVEHPQPSGSGGGSGGGGGGGGGGAGDGTSGAGAGVVSPSLTPDILPRNGGAAGDGAGGSGGGSGVGGGGWGGGWAGSGGKWGSPAPKAVAEATQNFITFMDALSLKYRAKVDLHPLLASVITSVDAVTGGEEFDGRADIVKWLITLNQMAVGDEIDEQQGKEMLWDLQRGYNAFMEGLG